MGECKANKGKVSCLSDFRKGVAISRFTVKSVIEQGGIDISVLVFTNIPNRFSPLTIIEKTEYSFTFEGDKPVIFCYDP